LREACGENDQKLKLKLQKIFKLCYKIKNKSYVSGKVALFCKAGDKSYPVKIMKDEIEIWEKESGVGFLKRIGIRPGQRILDFGARVGHYSIPAARIIGRDGIVYAMDKHHEALEDLKQKAFEQGLENINIIKSPGGTQISLEDESIDVVLLYDVLHYMKKSDRKKLYAEVKRVLRGGAILSVYPKHVREDHPLDEFRNMGMEDVKKEIQDAGLSFNQKICDTLTHDDWLNKGCVLNFQKSE
jgi:2-polyprenyl-3-methyl-5-hydroxy-6-metoxy-1,4-benzoquinol methylase